MRRDTSLDANAQLYYGQARSFPDALRLLAQAYQDEERLCCLPDLPPIDGITEMQRDLQTARDIYAHHIRAAEAAAAAEMRAAGLDMFADVLTTGDYSSLAF